MQLIFITILLCSCSPRHADNNALPRYSDLPDYGEMGAAADAGQVK